MQAQVHYPDAKETVYLESLLRRAPSQFPPEMGALPEVSELQLEQPQEQEQAESLWSEAEEIMIAQTVWGEARGQSTEEQAMVVWCIINRLESDEAAFVNQTTFEHVVTAANQFAGYSSTHPVEEELVALVQEVLQQWLDGGEPVVINPYASSSGYLYFYGDGEHNYFREEWRE